MVFSDLDGFWFFQVRIRGFSFGFRISGIWFLRIWFLFFGLGRFRFFQVQDLEVNWFVFRLDLVSSIFQDSDEICFFRFDNTKMLRKPSIL